MAPDPAWLRSQGKRTAVWSVGVLVIAAVVVVAWAGTPMAADKDKVESVTADPAITVEERPGGYVIKDTNAIGERTGLVFYPGGHVDPAAYLWTFGPLVKQTNVRVYITEMPLHLAVLDPGRAGEIIGTDPLVRVWFIGGHSLGGAMACQFAADNPSRVRGVVLLAGYCPAGETLNRTAMSLLVLYGSEDTVVTRDRLAMREWAPDDAQFVELDGLNHSSFAAYDGQPNDDPATVSARVARQRFVDRLVEWFDQRGG